MAKPPLPSPLDEPAAPLHETTQELLRRLLRALPPRSGTWFPFGAVIKVTGVAQNLLPANPLRQYLLLQAYSKNAASIWFDVTDMADNGPMSLELVPGQSVVFESWFVPTGQVWVNGTAGDILMGREGYQAPLSKVE